LRCGAYGDTRFWARNSRLRVRFVLRPSPRSVCCMPSIVRQLPSADKNVCPGVLQTFLRVQRSAIYGQRDCSNEGHLVRRAASTHATPFTAEVGIVDLDIATQTVALVSLSHHTAYLLLQQPRGAVGDAELAQQHKRGQTGLGLTDEVKGEEPCAQRQLGGVKHRPGVERRLVPAGRALHQRAVRHRRGDPVALRAAAFRAAKARSPSGLLQGRGALLFAAVALEEFAHAHLGLELDSVDRHGIDSARQRSQITGSVTHQMSLLSFMKNPDWQRQRGCNNVSIQILRTKNEHSAKWQISETSFIK
jgi:hypothetical protein